jgi:hypothetical protein
MSARGFIILSLTAFRIIQLQLNKDASLQWGIGHEYGNENNNNFLSKHTLDNHAIRGTMHGKGLNYFERTMSEEEIQFHYQQL